MLIKLYYIVKIEGIIYSTNNCYLFKGSSLVSILDQKYLKAKLIDTHDKIYILDKIIDMRRS